MNTFTNEETDIIVCALLKYVAELRSRSHLLDRFASPEHLQNHRAKISLGERLLNQLSPQQ